MRIEQRLTNTDILGRNFDHFIIVDIGDGLLQRHDLRWGEADCVILAGRAEVGQLLRLHRVDFKIFGFGIFADDHAFIQRFAGRDEQDAAFFQGAKGVCNCFAITV